MVKDYAELARTIVLDTFPHASTSVHPSGDGKTLRVSFEVEHHMITFDKLALLSQRLNTKLINFDKGDFSSGCGTCGHGSYSNVEVTVDKVRFNE